VIIIAKLRSNGNIVQNLNRCSAFTWWRNDLSKMNLGLFKFASSREHLPVGPEATSGIVFQVMEVHPQ